MTLRLIRGFVAILIVFIASFTVGAQDKVTLRYGTFGEPGEVAIRREQIAAFEAAHPHIEVDFYHLQGDRFERLMTLWAAGESMDLLYLNEWKTHDFIANQTMLPLNDFMARDRVYADDFYPVLIEACSHDGVVYCLPQEISPIVVYYNADWFDRLGMAPPSDDWSFDEFREIARLLSHGEVENRRYGFINWFWWGNFMPFIYSNGGEPFGPDGSAQFSTAAVREALQFQIDMVHVDNSTPLHQDFQGPWFSEEGYAMFLSGAWELPGFRHIAPLSFNWDVALPPGNVRQQTIAATLNYGISSQSNHPEEAWELLKFLTATEEGQYPVASMGMAVPGLRSSDLLSEFLWGSEGLPANAEVFLNAAAVTRLDFFGPRYREMDSIIWAAIDEMVRGEVTVAAGTEELDRVINAMLAE